MDLETVARTCMASTVQTKRFFCEKEGGPYDLGPLLELVMRDTGEHRIALVPDRDFIQITAELLAAGEQVDFLAFNADAYVREYPVDSGVTPDDIERGALEAAFQAGDFTVREQLACTVLEVKTDRVRVLVTAYHFNDDGTIRFSKTEELEAAGDGGQVVDNMREVAKQWR